MNKKVKASILMEVIISTFLVSLIALGILASLINLAGVNRKIYLLNEMEKVANSTMEEALAGININKDNNFLVAVEKSSFSDNLQKIEVKVTCEEINEEVKFISYQRTEN